MKGAAYRLIRKLGTEFDVQNATRDPGPTTIEEDETSTQSQTYTSGDRTTPTYEPVGTVRATLEERRTPGTERDSSGEEVDHDLELRAVDVDVELFEAGDDDWPTRFVHRSGTVYELVASHEEDTGVMVLAVRRR